MNTNNVYKKLNLINNNDRLLLNQLDWDNIVQKIASATYFDEAKSELYSAIGLKSIAEINATIKDILIVIELIREGHFLSIQSYFSSLNSSNLVNDYISRLAKSSLLSLSELNQLAKTIECFTNLINNYPSINDIIHKNSDIDKTNISDIRRNFISKLRSFVSFEGNVDYLAHPLLSPHFIKLQEIELQIKEELKKILRSKEMEKILRYDQYDVMNDHYVIPVRSDSYNSNLGQIIAHSDSGLTLYVEPFRVKDKCNKRITLIAKIDEIIFHICKDFCEKLAPHHQLLSNIRKSLCFLDVMMSKAKYSYDNDFCIPEITSELQINIKGLAHPLIDKPVTNSINITATEKGIIISGPNTGGKTVALKSLTLAHLFLHFGLLIPAYEATLHPYSNIYFFSHDQQDLAQGLSSFSAEVKNYLQLLREIKNESLKTNLIIIDEIFNTTSSEEASALAISLFEEMDKDNSKIVVSTHHQMLKTFMHKDDEYISCHVGYDFDNNRPTYKIISGTPGSSLATTIFKNLSQKYFSEHAIVENAHKLLDNKSISYEILLQDLTKKELELNKLIEENKIAKKNLANERSKLDGIYKLKSQCKYEEYERNLDEIFKDANNLLDEIKKGESKNLKSYVLTIQELRSKIRKHNPSANAINVESKKETFKSIKQTSNLNDENLDIGKFELIVGQKYRSSTLKKDVVLTSINNKKKQVVVKQGNVTVTLPISDLKISKQMNDGKFHFSLEKNVFNDQSTDEIENDKKSDLPPFHFDCRGMRIDEFERTIEKVLDDLLTADIPYAIIIHGHGTGALRKWLQDCLKQHPEFAFEIPDQSSYGATKIFCK